MNTRITIFFLMLYTYIGTAQEDSLWKITDRVYIRAPRTTTTKPYTSIVYTGLGNSLTRTSLTHNYINWEDNKYTYEARADYYRKSINLMKYAKDLEELGWMPNELKCYVMGEKMKPVGVGHIENRISLSDYKLTLQEQINEKYYYLDKRTTSLFFGRRRAKFLGISYFTNASEYESKYTRYLLVDSVLYEFIIIAKKRITNKKRKFKYTNTHQPAFYKFLERIVIREEEEE